MRVRRPPYLVNSTVGVEDASGRVVGEVFQRWHLLRRNYDVYVDKCQFAAIRGATLAWEFLLQNERGEALARIDRNFSGWGKELFTDAGQYAVFFGNHPATPQAEELARRQQLEQQQQQEQQLGSVSSWSRANESMSGRASSRW